MQFWTIDGKTYNHHQLMEMKREKALKEKKALKKEKAPVKKESAPVEKDGFDGMKFFTLKKIAKDKGMEVTNETKKADILEFLNK